MNEYATHARALKSLQDRLADECPVIVWGAQEYRIIPNSALRRGDLGPGGITLNADLQFEALTAEFLSDDLLTVADVKDALLTTRLEYLTDVYKVDAVHIRPGALQIQVQCTSVGQKA